MKKAIVNSVDKCACYAHNTRVARKNGKTPRKTGSTKYLSLSQDSLKKCGDLMKVMKKPSLVKVVEALILEAHKENVHDKRTYYFPEDI